MNRLVSRKSKVFLRLGQLLRIKFTTRLAFVAIKPCETYSLYIRGYRPLYERKPLKRFGPRRGAARRGRARAQRAREHA